MRLIDQEGKNLGETSLDQALYLAYDEGLDLIEVGPNANPPVCKIMDFGKYKFELGKEERKKHKKAGELKEIRMTAGIDEHDLEVKTKKAQEFLSKGNKVKLTVVLKGREMIYPQRAYGLLEEVKNKLGAAWEKSVEKLGRQFFGILVKDKEQTAVNSDQGTTNK